MSDQFGHDPSSHDWRRLPDHPDLRHLKLEAKRRLSDGEFTNLQQAQRAIAQEHGVASWTQLKRLIEEKSQGDVAPACSFCGKGPSETGRLFAGPGVWICDVCVTTCYGLLEQLGDLSPDQDEDGPSMDADGATPGRIVRTGADPESEPDATMATIAYLQQLALAGRRREALAGFGALWLQLEHSTDHIARVYVAHYLADLQNDATSELEWDFRALNAASEAESTPSGAERIRQLRPSLHLNAARGLHRIGREAEAREQLALSERGRMNLSETGYGYLIRTEITRARADMDSVESLPLPLSIEKHGSA